MVSQGFWAFFEVFEQNDWMSECLLEEKDQLSNFEFKWLSITANYNIILFWVQIKSFELNFKF